MSTETNEQVTERRLENANAHNLIERELALLEQWRTTVEADLLTTKASIKALEEERTKALKWGIATLGAAVLAMGSWMWTYVSSHLR